MKNACALKFLTLMIVVFAANNTFTAETTAQELGIEKSLNDLPKDILGEISSFLPNLKAANIKEYFTALDNFRLTGKTAKEAVDTYVTNFLKKNAVTIDPKIGAYITFKNYLALSFLLQNKEFQLDEEKAKEEETNLEHGLSCQKRSTYYDPNESDSDFKIKMAISLKYADWLLNNKISAKNYYDKLQSQKRVIAITLNSAIESNNLKLVYAILYFANPNIPGYVSSIELYMKPLEVARRKEAKLKPLLQSESNDRKLLEAQKINQNIISLLISKGAK